MTEPSAGPDHLHRRRLFFGICLALIPTGASFALVSNILVPLKQQFILTNTGTATVENVTLAATPPTGWDVTFDQETVNVPVDAPVTVTATITPSGEAVAGDYVITFKPASAGLKQARLRVELVDGTVIWRDIEGTAVNP